MLRIGNGYDVHRLVEGRRLMLGGVEVPHTKGVLGHSDGDVLLHAITDAIIGALGLGDIGLHFPDNDENLKDIDSAILLKKINNIMKEKNYRIVNLDSIIVIQKPKLRPHIDSIRDNIAKILEIEPELVNVKAKTEEKLGFTGDETGVKSYCVVLLEKIMLDKTSFRKSVLTFLLPIAIQNLINVAISSTDVIMLGRYSEVALSASSLAGQVQFILILLFFGIASGATVLTAQYWGKKDIKSIEKVLAIGIKIAFFVSIGFFIFAFFFSRTAMRLFSNDEATILQGIRYLKIVSFSYLTTSISIVYLVTMRSVERVGVSTVAYATSFVSNLIINYLLIYGNFGFPEMGVEGAAIGTLVARIIELGIVFYYNSKNHHFVSIKWKYIKSLDPVLKKDFFKYSAPTMMNELLWAGGTAAGIAILGRLGTSIVAANSITSVVRQLAMVFAFGLANTAAVMVGKEIGKKDFHTAEIYAKKLLFYSFLSSLVGVALLYIAKPFIISKFALNAEVEDFLNHTINVLFYYIPLQSISAVLIVGVFRAGGDTKFALISDAIPLWCGSVLLSAIGAFYLGLSTKLVYILIMSDEIIKLPLIIWRYRSRKWINNITRELK